MGIISFQDFRKNKLESLKIPQLYKEWKSLTAGKLSYLMICHDDRIDRRILQEAHALEEKGWVGIIIAISFDDDDLFEIVEGIPVHRIGRRRISANHLGLFLYADYYEYFLYNLIKIIKHTISDFFKFCKKYEVSYKKQCVTSEIKFTKNYKSNKLKKIIINLILKWPKALLNFIYFKNIRSGNPLPFDEIFYNAGLNYPSSLVQAHDLPALKTSVELAKLWKVPVIYDAHEFYPEICVFSKNQRKYMHDVEKKYINKCDLTFCVNKDLSDCIAIKYDCKKPIELFNAIDAPCDLNKNEDRFRKYFNINKSQKIFLYQGCLSRNRNLEELLKGFAHANPVNSVLIFMGYGDLADELNYLQSIYKIEGRVFVKNAVSHDELLYWTCCADIGIIPYKAVDINTMNVMPNKLFEFIQAELPILANDLPGLRRIVDGNKFGIVANLNTTTGIANAFTAFSKLSNEFDIFHQNLRNKKALFSWKTQSSIYTDAVSKLKTKSFF